MEVNYNRKYLPAEKKKKIEQMATTMKTVAEEMLNDAEWLGGEGKTKILKEFTALKIQIGLPGDYSHDKIFDYADVDLVNGI